MVLTRIVRIFLFWSSRRHSDQAAPYPAQSPPVSDVDSDGGQERVIDLRRRVPGAPPMRVPSAWLPGRHYSVDLAQMSCTCSRFRAKQKRYGKNNPAAWCKHVVRARLMRAGIPDALVSLILLERQLPVYFRYIGDDTLVVSVPDSDWHYVYVSTLNSARYQGAYRRCCYNSAERRWASNQLPRHKADAVASAIDRRLRTGPALARS